MALDIQQINPLDLQPSVGVGVKIPFTADYVFTTTYTTKDATKTNLINFLLTNPGERFFNPLFGAGINALLFNQSTIASEELLQSRIETVIAQYFPQIQVIDLLINSNRDQNIVTISLKYAVTNTNIQDQLYVNIEI